MKMQDSDIDKELEQFFLEMKEKDQQMPIPPFIQSKKRSIWKFIPYGIAASVLFALWFFTGKQEDFKLEQDVIIITLEEGQNNELQFRIETTTELESWESPTSSLLTEF